MTLDLNPCNNNENSTKKLKLQPTILTSPDLSMLEFNSPQLESFDLSQQTTLGHIISTPTPSLILKSVTMEQKLYVQPFVEALQCTHHNENSNGDIQVDIPMTDSDINSSEYQSEPQNFVLVTSNDFSNFMPLDVEEPQIVPSVTSSPPPMSPTDIEYQEKIKLEEKRKTNRVAASKCRLRKLERIAKLVDNIKVLKNENNVLTTELSSVLEQICQLKQTIVEHMKNRCEFPTAVAYEFYRELHLYLPQTENQFKKSQQIC
ncbi:transcription factor AP-1-like [Acyrthosiphon pisum]|uniref:BZIP domain-containing protein n=1 Tax=Acyrthosiphon pisum TaxID=7029 RepID=A0A8R1W7P1_ACYPI|nr:transcription factor AP-1-like [Acyrthosiphon pisum]|eukprot:XP_001949916.1 PREDICTED: transcription factor AP-1-like [Acyrthosiphon pisum]